ncbi:unnamed protein product, partial [Rotaria sp. Silwood1]
DIHVDIEKCMHPCILQWLCNYNDMTSGQPLSLYYALMATIAHLSIESVSKSGSIRECREALEELYEFLITHGIGNPNAIHSILDQFTDAGFTDQVN